MIVSQPEPVTRARRLSYTVFAAIGLLGAVTACTAQPADADTTTATTATTAIATSSGSTAISAATRGSSTSSGTTPVGTDASSESSYADGTYTATGSYTSPGGQERVSVEVTLAEDIVTAVTVTPAATNQNSIEYQTQFVENIAAEVVGVDIDDLDVSTVAGSSLTSGGFNQAIETIKSEASV